MADVTTPVSSFSSSGPSVEYRVPICSTIFNLTLLPDEVLRLRSSGSVGLLVGDLGPGAVMIEEGDQGPVIYNKPFLNSACGEVSHQSSLGGHSQG